jgi:large subunit ribosomal protein L19
VERIELIRGGKVRRAKLYYLRKRIGSQATRVEEEAATTEGTTESVPA